MLIKYFLFVLGLLFLGIAILGYVIPPVPATPFLLIAAFCFSRSSPRLYNWILNRKHVGSIVKNYIEHRVLSMRLKIFFVSGTLFFAIYVVGFVLEQWWSRFFVGFVLFVTIIIILLHSSEMKYLSKQKTANQL